MMMMMMMMMMMAATLDLVAREARVEAVLMILDL
jgi:hypothetical protein